MYDDHPNNVASVGHRVSVRGHHRPSLGAKGWVVKTMVASNLLTAVDAALDGRQFLSSGLSVQESTTQAQTTISG
jgi:hypothetical protein